MWFGPQKLHPGDELTTTWLNKLVMWCKRNTLNLGVNSGLDMIQNDAGTFLRLSGRPGTGRLAITYSTITAATTGGGCSVGGFTPGSGTVNWIYFDGTCANPDTTDTPTVYNFSTTSGGIASGTFVWCSQDQSGNWWITAVDCGNG